MTYVLILSVIFGACCTLAENSEYTTTSENPKRLSNSEDRFLTSVIRGKNSSEFALDNIDEEGTKKADKKPRTVLHRDSSLERDKSIIFFDLVVVVFLKPVNSERCVAEKLTTACEQLGLFATFFHFQVSVAAALNTVPADLRDLIIIITRSLQRSDGIPLNITNVTPLTGNSKIFYTERKKS